MISRGDHLPGARGTPLASPSAASFGVASCTACRSSSTYRIDSAYVTADTAAMKAFHPFDDDRRAGTTVALAAWFTATGARSHGVLEITERSSLLAARTSAAG